MLFVELNMYIRTCGCADSKGSSFPSPPHQGGCAKTPSHSSSSSTPKPRDGSYGTPTTPSHGSRSATTPATTPPTSSHATTPTTPSHSTTPSTPSHTTTPATPSIPGFPSITATCEYAMHAHQTNINSYIYIYIYKKDTICFFSVRTLLINLFTLSTCSFWRTHPSMIFGILGQWSNIGNLFGFPATSIFGRNPSVPQALGNARNDGYGALFREGTASLLNSMANPSFPLTTQVVRDRFNQALSSEKTASAEAQRFRLANEGA